MPESPLTVSADTLALTADEKASLTRFLQQLVQMPSVSGQEKAVAHLIKTELQAAGVEDVHIDPVGNVIARLGQGSPTLLYDAHMDTVAPAGEKWAHDPYEATIEGDTLYGLGACDMKGAVAAMVCAARKLTEVSLGGSLVMAFVVQEEPCEGYALQHIVERQGIHPDYVLIGEPSDMRIMLGHRGRVLFKVTVRGKASHASRPELGFNAVSAAARLIFGIDMLAADLPTDPFMGPGSVAVTHIKSQSVSMNAIPHLCTFAVDRRLTLGETPARAQSQIEQLIEQEGLDATIEIVAYDQATYTGHTFSVAESFNAWALDEEHPLTRRLKATAKAVLGQEPQTDRWPFSTDGVYSMGKANIPTIGFGPGDPALAHTPNEHIKLSDVHRAAQVYAAFAVNLLNA